MKEERFITWGLSVCFIIFFLMINNQKKEVCPVELATLNPLTNSLNEVIQQGFETANVQILYPHFDELISICINKEEAPYLAYNAQSPIKFFFEQHPPKKMHITDHGESNSSNEAFWIGIYEAKEGKQFRFLIISENHYIQYIEIEELSEIS